MADRNSEHRSPAGDLSQPAKLTSLFAPADQPIPFRRTKSCVARWTVSTDESARKSNSPARCFESNKQATVSNSSNRTRQWSDRSVLRKCVRWLDSYLSDEECNFQGTVEQSWLNQPLSHSYPVVTRVLCGLSNSIIDPETGSLDRKSSARTVATCLLATLSADHLDPRMHDTLLPILQSVICGDDQQLEQPELPASLTGAEEAQTEAAQDEKAFPNTTQTESTSSAESDFASAFQRALQGSPPAEEVVNMPAVQGAVKRTAPDNVQFGAKLDRQDRQCADPLLPPIDQAHLPPSRLLVLQPGCQAKHIQTAAMAKQSECSTCFHAISSASDQKFCSFCGALNEYGNQTNQPLCAAGAS